MNTHTEQISKQPATFTEYLTVIGYGLVAAFITGLIWYLFGIGTGLEISWIAAGVALAVGIAIKIKSNKKKYYGLSAIGIILTVLSITFAKYFVFIYLYNKIYKNEVDFIPVNPFGLKLFFRIITDVRSGLFGVASLIFLVMAIFIVWKVVSIKN